MDRLICDYQSLGYQDSQGTVKKKRIPKPKSNKYSVDQQFSTQIPITTRNLYWYHQLMKFQEKLCCCCLCLLSRILAVWEWSELFRYADRLSVCLHTIYRPNTNQHESKFLSFYMVNQLNFFGLFLTEYTLLDLTKQINIA